MTTLMQDDKNELINILKARNINYLVHFTNISNLDHILKYGLMPKNQLHDNNILFYNNDTLRVDGTDAVCMSIEFPNYKMFYKYRQNNSSINWVVIKISANVLYELDCAYCIENAASNRVSSIPINARKTVSAFLQLYGDYSAIQRSALNIPDNYPTNPQAEILVFECIPTTYFKEICFNNKNISLENINNYPNIEFSYAPDMFEARCDFQYWKKYFI